MMLIEDNVDILGMNSMSWYKEVLILKIERMAILCIIGNLELSLRHPDMPKNTREDTIEIGRKLALRLIDDGMIIPVDVMEAWCKTFGINRASTDI